MATAAAIVAQTAAFLPEFIDMAVAQDDIAVAIDTIAGIDAANAFADGTAIPIIAAITSVGVSFLYQQLAQKYYDKYSQQRTFYYNNFQNNIAGELGLIQQTQGLPLYAPQYVNQTITFAAFEAINMFSGNNFNIDWWRIHANMYHDAQFNLSLDAYGAGAFDGAPLAIDNASIEDDFDTYLFRYEEHRKDVYDERRWEWQNQSLNFGVKQASIIQSGLATSFGFIDTATGTMADFFATQANGLARYGAYRDSLASNGAQFSNAANSGRRAALSTGIGIGGYTRGNKSYGTGSNQGDYMNELFNRDIGPPAQ